MVWAMVEPTLGFRSTNLISPIDLSNLINELGFGLGPYMSSAHSGQPGLFATLDNKTNFNLPSYIINGTSVIFVGNF